MQLIETIQKLAQQLLDPCFRKTHDVSLLLANEFVEFGSSGGVYNKEEVIESLLNENNVNLSMMDFKVTELSPTVVLATYKAIKNKDQNPQITLRSSIWKFIDNCWQMVFHQGTRFVSHAD